MRTRLFSFHGIVVSASAWHWIGECNKSVRIAPFKWNASSISFRLDDQRRWNVVPNVATSYTQRRFVVVNPYHWLLYRSWGMLPQVEQRFNTNIWTQLRCVIFECTIETWSTQSHDWQINERLSYYSLFIFHSWKRRENPFYVYQKCWNLLAKKKCTFCINDNSRRNSSTFYW